MPSSAPAFPVASLSDPSFGGVTVTTEAGLVAALAAGNSVRIINRTINLTQPLEIIRNAWIYLDNANLTITKTGASAAILAKVAQGVMCYVFMSGTSTLNAVAAEALANLFQLDGKGGVKIFGTGDQRQLLRALTSGVGNSVIVTGAGPVINYESNGVAHSATSTGTGIGSLSGTTAQANGALAGLVPQVPLIANGSLVAALANIRNVANVQVTSVGVSAILPFWLRFGTTENVTVNGSYTTAASWTVGTGQTALVEMTRGSNHQVAATVVATLDVAFAATVLATIGSGNSNLDIIETLSSSGAGAAASALTTSLNAGSGMINLDRTATGHAGTAPTTLVANEIPELSVAQVQGALAVTAKYVDMLEFSSTSAALATFTDSTPSAALAASIDEVKLAGVASFTFATPGKINIGNLSNQGSGTVTFNAAANVGNLNSTGPVATSASGTFVVNLNAATRSGAAATIIGGATGTPFKIGTDNPILGALIAGANATAAFSASQPTAIAITATTATLTAAQLLDKATFIGTTTGPATAIYTTALGSELDTAYPDWVVGQSRIFTIINATATPATNTITLAFGAGVTNGGGVLTVGAAAPASSSGTFRLLKTGVATYLAFRLS